MNICFISYRYPGRHNSTDFVFVKHLVDAVAENGHHCYVLSPFNILHYRRLTDRMESYSCGRGMVTVCRPTYLSFASLHFGSFYVSTWLFKCALKRAFKMMKIIPDIVYGHFWDMAYSGYDFAKKNHVPLFVASGESEISKLFSIPKDVREFGEYVRGVICVSGKNRDESIRMGLTTIDKCGVFPNAVNPSFFHKKNKAECRDRLGFPPDAFIVAFVGWFNERKGVTRVGEAIQRVGGINSIFIGGGELDPECEGILFKGSLPHNEIPLYLCAADCFVLPTQHEGCCNAIVEALSCGLPVVSSNMPFNWDVLDETNSLLVDPNDIDQIAIAIRRLRDNPELLSELSSGALKRAESLTIEERSRRILEFIQLRLKAA